MQDRCLNTPQGTFQLGVWDGKNESGIAPVGDRVLVLVDAAAEFTAGGIMTTQKTQEAVSLASTSGILIACGPMAFAYDSNRTVHWTGDRPQPGARVWFSRYAGQEYTGIGDGKLYRVMEDSSVAGVETAVSVEIPIRRPEIAAAE